MFWEMPGYLDLLKQRKKKVAMLCRRIRCDKLTVKSTSYDVQSIMKIWFSLIWNKYFFFCFKSWVLISLVITIQFLYTAFSLISVSHAYLFWNTEVRSAFCRAALERERGAYFKVRGTFRMTFQNSVDFFFQVTINSYNYI